MGPGGCRAPSDVDPISPLSRMRLDLRVGRVEQRVDVGVLVGQDRLDDRVEGRVEVLGVERSAR